FSTLHLNERKKTEVVFTASFLDGGTGFWNLPATVETLCYKSRSLPRLRCPARFIAASQLQNHLSSPKFFVQNSNG
ncbi:hypothetical protein VIGAN_01094300, partial [Vigna angularis var. angularis]